MGLLTPSGKERLLLQKEFEEKCKLIGVEGFYYEVKDLNLSKTSFRDNVQYFDPVPICFIFEDMPNPRTLKNLNWWDDSDETTPPIAYLPWHLNQESNYELKPAVGSKLELTDPLGGESRFYEIEEVNANSLYLIYSIVKLTPLRETVKVVEDIIEKMDDPSPAEPGDVTPEVKPTDTDYQFITPAPKAVIKDESTSKSNNSGYSFLNVGGDRK